MNLESLADFFIETNNLKSTVRYESCPEQMRDSTAAHSWNVCRMIPSIAMELNLSINVLHAMDLANVHDLAEYIRKRDFDAYLVNKGILKREDKEKEELKVMESLRDNFEIGKLVFSLWGEYQECKTPEARFVKGLDKLESHFHFIDHKDNWPDQENIVYQITYADKAVRNFPQLEPLLKVAKQKLRPLVEARGIVWKKEYNYPD